MTKTKLRRRKLTSKIAAIIRKSSPYKAQPQELPPEKKEPEKPDLEPGEELVAVYEDGRLIGYEKCGGGPRPWLDGIGDWRPRWE